MNCTTLNVDLGKKSFDRICNEIDGQQVLYGQALDPALSGGHLSWRSPAPGAENVLLFGVGPLAGTMFPGAGVASFFGRSSDSFPVRSGRIAGDFGSALRSAGYNRLSVSGTAQNPCCLYISDDIVEIRDCSLLQFRNMDELAAAVTEELDDPDVKIIATGISGDNGVAGAVAQCCRTRSGSVDLGHIMVRMNLKVIAVSGTGGVRVSEPENFFRTCLQLHREIAETGKGGTKKQSSQTGFFDRGGMALFTSLGNGRLSCAGCGIGCYARYHVYSHQAVLVGSKELQGLGELLSFDQPEQVAQYIRFCQNSGLDSRWFARIYNWLCELTHRKILDPVHVDGIRVHGGNQAALMDLAQKTVTRSGVGDILAGGVESASRFFGQRLSSWCESGYDTAGGGMQMVSGSRLSDLLGICSGVSQILGPARLGAARLAVALNQCCGLDLSAADLMDQLVEMEQHTSECSADGCRLYQ